MHSPRVIRAFVSVLALLTVTLLFVAGCSQKPPAPPAAIPPAAPGVSSDTATPALEEARIVGNEACADCHAAEVKSHNATGHAHTLHTMNQESLGKQAPPGGRIPGTDIVLTPTNGRYLINTVGDKEDPMHLNFALGSGKTGMTYVALMSDGSLLELRKSYFPSAKKWYLTPGHDKKQTSGLGEVYNSDVAQQCILCHATALPGHVRELKPSLFGVGCESCHGPGSSHVDSMRAANALDGTKHAPSGTKLYMEKMNSWSGTQVNELCGQCHRAPQAVNTQTKQANMTNRFQPYGLMISRCFKESGGKVSCVTCHNPHDNASTDLKSYEAACLKCHASPGSEHIALKDAVAAKACPVSPKSGCIPCHMPSRKVFSDTSLPTRMADHKIAVHK
jgi:hypothetical protein